MDNIPSSIHPNYKQAPLLLARETGSALSSIRSGSSFLNNYRSCLYRFVLANTEVLHDKITILANRVRALEDALQHAQSQLTNEEHPLLTEDLRALKRPLERESPEEQAQEQEHETIESINVGSL